MRNLLAHVLAARGWRMPAALACMVLAALGLVLSPLLSAGEIAHAGSGPPPLRAHHGHKVLLPGAVPPALRRAKRLGHEDATRQLQLTIFLALSDPDGLAALIAGQHDPHSPQYRKYLTPKAFAQRFGPTKASVAAARQFLAGAGLRVTGGSANGTLLHASGTVAQVEQAFGVTIGRYQLGGREVYGPDQAPQIPDTLAAIVLNVGGLDDLFQPRPALASAGAGIGAPVAPGAPASRRLPASGPVPGAFGPTDLRSAYDVANLIGASGDGTGQRVAVFELAPYIVGDITGYRTQYSLPNPTLPNASINNIAIDGASPTCASGGSACDNGSGIGEADLDIEVVSAIAPNATQDVYVAPNSEAGVLDAYNQIVIDDNDAVATTSWGLCEPLAGSYELHALDNIFLQAAAQGQTFFSAAGDFGSDDCSQIVGPGLPPSVRSPGDDPNVVDVGGTQLTLSGGNYGSETAWNDGFGAGGGGLSSYFTQPAYQVGGGVQVGNSYYTGERELPDVSASSDLSYSVYCSSTVECSDANYPWAEFYGTSGATPLWAGVLTDVNTYLIANAVAPLGWANQALYQLFANGQTNPPYHDVTTGTNDFDYGVGSPYHGEFPATACYDLATGMGSPDAWNIARDAQGGIQTGGGGPCPNTAPATTELIQDGGFEQPPGSSPWTQFSIQGYPVILSAAVAHTGNAAFFPCGYATCDDRVAQAITVPATVHHATLRFWLETFSPLPTISPTPPCVDRFYATLATADGTVLGGGGAVLTACENAPVFSYQFESFDLTSLLQAHTGQQLVVMFRGTTANEAGAPQFYTGWAVDDVSLSVS